MTNHPQVILAHFIQILRSLPKSAPADIPSDRKNSTGKLLLRSALNLCPKTEALCVCISAARRVCETATLAKREPRIGWSCIHIIKTEMGGTELVFRPASSRGIDCTILQIFTFCGGTILGLVASKKLQRCLYDQGRA